MIYKKRVVIVNDNDLSNDINSAQEAADSAILEQQRIYYRSKEGRIPYGAADPTDIWITNHDDRYNELSNENAATAWSTKITPIARGIDSNENEDKYLYLYTCVQKRIVSKDAVKYTLSSDTTVNASKLYYERSGMTDNYVYTVISNPSGNPHDNQYYEQSPKVPHTEILLDETTTVIDGGKIITGSIMANRLNAGNINAWHQLSIGAFDAETTKAISNSTYITFIDTQTGIHVHNVDDENNYVQINATDIQLVRANVPRMILGTTNFSFHDANGTQRLLLNANDGAIIGYTNNIYTQVKNEGFYIYNGASSQTNKKLTQITSSGLEIFDSTDGSSIAFYGQATRIGKENSYHTTIDTNGLHIWAGTESTATNEVALFSTTARIGKSTTSHVDIDYHSLQLIDKDGGPYFYVSDLRGTNGVAQIILTYIGDGSTDTFPISPDATDTNYTVTISDGSGAGMTKGTTSLEFVTAPNDGSVITITYNTTSPDAKAYSLGLRRNNSNIGAMSFIEGWHTEASGDCSHAEGSSTIASGGRAHAEGQLTTAKGYVSHAEGINTLASGEVSHAEGGGTIASGQRAHAEGDETQATGYASHAEGIENIASGQYSHAEGGGQGGNYTIAQGHASHAEGRSTTSAGHASHAQNVGTRAKKDGQTAIGFFNIVDNSTGSSISGNGYAYDRGTYAFIIGNGDDTTRSNALTIDWKGGIQMYLDSNGTSSAAATSGTDKDLFNAIRTLGWYSSVIV